MEKPFCLQEQKVTGGQLQPEKLVFCINFSLLIFEFTTESFLEMKVQKLKQTFKGRMVDGILYIPASEQPQSLMEEDSQLEMALSVSLEEHASASRDQLDREQKVYQQNYQVFLMREAQLDQRLCVADCFEREDEEIFEEERNESYLRSVYDFDDTPYEDVNLETSAEPESSSFSSFSDSEQ